MTIILVERLTAWAWMRSVVPTLRGLKRQRQRVALEFVDGTTVGLFLARHTGTLFGAVSITQRSFRLIELKDEQGQLLRLRLPYEDFAEIQDAITSRPLFVRALHEVALRGRLGMFLKKSVIHFDILNREALFRSLLLIHVAARAKSELRASNIFLLLGYRPWTSGLEAYAKRFGVTLGVSRSLQSFRRELLLQNHPWLRTMYYGLHDWMLSFRQAYPLNEPQRSHSQAPQAARLAIEYYGNLSLDHPELYGDLSFLHQSAFPSEKVVMAFYTWCDPLNEEILLELNSHTISAVVTHPRARVIRAGAFFNPWIRPRRRTVLPDEPRSPELQWLRAKVREYENSVAYWRAFFQRFNARIYLTWYRHHPVHCAIADAIREVGGIAVIYQRSFNDVATRILTASVDVAFGYSYAASGVERASGSEIGYHVVTGYLGDHRFPLLKPQAAEYRQQLKRAGAEHILAYLDENSGEDERWHTGHRFMQENYAFVLERLLQDPALGLIIKPKHPPNLRRRLGPVAPLLARAEKTGRCILVEAGAMHSTVPPALAALAADMTIHGHLCAGTAGIEAALAGCKTILLDREGWPKHTLYKLGKDVVFTNWAALWQAFEEHRHSSVGNPRLGVWTEMLPQLDPFRDGRASERMGNYLHWLLDGLQAGRPREQVLEEAAARYRALWGKDTVTRIP